MKLSCFLVDVLCVSANGEEIKQLTQQLLFL